MVAYENGKIPPDLLRRVSNFRPLYKGVTSGAGSDLLREDAWAALNMLQLAFFKGFERPLNVSEAYRGLNRQTAVWQIYKGGGPLAAPVGTSNHGWAVAVDFGSGVATYGSAAKYWMDRNAPRWGWHPVGNGFGKPEAWHFEFKPNTATETIPASSGATPFPDQEEDDMYSDEDRTLAKEDREALAKVKEEVAFIRQAVGLNSGDDSILKAIAANAGVAATAAAAANNAINSLGPEDQAAGRPSMRAQVRNVYDFAYGKGPSLPDGNAVSIFTRILKKLGA